MINRIFKIVTIIQARTGSTRLPGKVLLPAAGKPLLLQMAERVSCSKLAGTIVIATTSEPEDDVIEDLCLNNDLNCFRGSTLDLLDRHFKTAIKYSADIVLKIPSDCPLIDPEIIDNVIKYYIRNRDRYDYVSNLHPQSYPDGNDVEVFSFNALYKAYKHAVKIYEREHTTPYIWNNSDLFKIGNYEWEAAADLSRSHRFVLDYPADYEFIRSVYDELYYTDNSFTLYDILDLLDIKPSIKDINSHLNGNSWYDAYRNDFNKPVHNRKKLTKV